MAGNGVPQASTTQSIPSPFYENPLTAALKGFQQFQAQGQQQQLFQAGLKQQQVQTADAQAQMQQRSIEATQQQQAFSTQQYQQLGQRFIGNPALMNNPQARAQLSSLAQMSGQPEPFGQDGQLDKSAFLTPFSPQDELTAMAMPIQQRKTFLDMHSGVPPAAYTDPVNYMSKASVDYMKAVNSGIHLQNQDNATQQRADALTLRADLAKTDDPVKRQLMQSQITKNDGEARAAAARATVSIQQAGMLQQEVQGNMGTYRALEAQYKSNPSMPMQHAMTSQYNRLLTSVDRATQHLADFKAQYAQAFSAGADQATVLEPLAAKLAGAQQAYNQAVQTAQSMYSLLESNAGPANHLRSGMGAKSVSVGGPLNLQKPPELIQKPTPLNFQPTGSDPTDSSTTKAYIDPSNPPAGTMKTTAGGATYYKTSDGTIYDSSGLPVSGGN